MGTSSISFHRGQEVTGLTTTVATLGEAVGSRSWADNDRVVIYDGTGYKVESAINDAGIETTDTTITVDSQAALANVGVGATLNGTTQYFYGGNVLSATTNDISISAWIKTTATSNGMLVGKRDQSTGTTKGYEFFYWGTAGANQGKLTATLADGSATRLIGYSTVTVNDGKWHHVAVVYDRDGNATFYIDGYASGSFAISSQQLTIDDAYNFIVGRNHNVATYFNGSIRDVRIYIAAGANWSAANILTQATNPHNNAVGGTNTSSWYFDDAAAAANADADGMITDNTSTNHLDAVGGTTTNYGTHSRTQQAFISKNLVIGDENGGIGGISNIASTWTITKNTSIVKFDTRSLKGVNVAGNDNDEFTPKQFTLSNGVKYFYKFWVRIDAIHANSDLYFDIDGAANIVSRQVDTGNDDLGVAYATTVWRCFYGTFTADQDGVHNWNIRITGAGAGTNSATIYCENFEIRTLIAGNALVASTYYTLIYNTDLGTTGFLWSGLGSNATEVQAGDLYLELDQAAPTTATPTTAVNSFITGKWGDLQGGYQSDGLDTITFASSEIPTSKGTIATWVNIQSPYTTGDDKVFFGVRGANDNNRIKIYYQASSDKFVAYLNGADRLLASAETNNTKFYTWVHITLSYDFVNDLYALYINGTSVATDTTALTAPVLSGNAFIGSDYSSINQGDVRIDEFRIYDVSMTARQVKMLYYEIKPTWR